MKTSVAIVGAGIGGVTLAQALDRSGFQVTLLEQAGVLSEIGAGLSVWENGLHALHSIDLRNQVEASGHAWSEYEIHRAKKRVVLRNNKKLSIDGTVSPLIIKRGVLFGILRDSLSSRIDVETSFKVTEICGNTVIAEDGRTRTANVIIGADGAYSRVRKELTEATPRFCSQICFRGLGKLAGDTPVNGAEIFNLEQHRFGYFQLPGNEVYWFDIVDNDQPYGQFENYRSDIERLSPFVSDLVKSTPADSIVCHPIEEMRPVIKVSEHVALIGDAAHPMQPSLGQGACLALEDAVVLADCLKLHSDNIPKALNIYLSKRKRRWNLYYNMCRQLGTGALDKGAFGRKMAIARMVHTPEWTLSFFGRRIFEFKQQNINFPDQATLGSDRKGGDSHD